MYPRISSKKMPSWPWSCCFLIFLLLERVFCQTANIVNSPKSANITESYTTLVNCTAIGSYINWKVNDSPVNDDLQNQGFHELTTVDLNVTENLRIKSLQVLGSPHSNNVSIVCVALLQVSTTNYDAVSSEPALVLVQGLLESVSNLTVNPFNSTTVLISWSPPFTLEGVPILGYNVTITYTTSGKNETMLVEDTTLLYSIDHPDPENNFTVTVVPINEVGAGQPATLVFFLSLTTNTSVGVKISPTNTLYATTATASTILPSNIHVNTTGAAPPTDPSQPEPGNATTIIIIVLVSVVIIFITVICSIVICITCRHCHKNKKRGQKKCSDEINPLELHEVPKTNDNEVRDTFRVNPVFAETDDVGIVRTRFSSSSEGRDVNLSGLSVESHSVDSVFSTSIDKPAEVSAYSIPPNKAVILRRSSSVKSDDSYAYVLVPKEFPSEVHLLSESKLPSDFLSSPEDATSEAAFLVHVNQRRSLSDDNHKGTLRRRSSDISSGHDKLPRQRKSHSGLEDSEPLLDEDDDLRDEYQDQSEKSKQEVSEKDYATISHGEDKDQAIKDRVPTEEEIESITKK